jgi:hypothetical protein
VGGMIHTGDLVVITRRRGGMIATSYRKHKAAPQAAKMEKAA